MTRATSPSQSCPICDGAIALLGVVDFNKSCEEARGKFLPPAGVPVQYSRCERCGFCFVPEMYEWSLEDFATKIYNSHYAEVDPDYLDARPRGYANTLMQMFQGAATEIRHLDYGGGNGLLSNILADAGWYSTSYDPFVNHEIRVDDFGKFDLITAFEVFEHVPNPRRLSADLGSLLDEDGILLFSTLLSDGNISTEQALTWWYASPRNGHISLYSRESLAILGTRESFKFGSFSVNLHAYWRRLPAWGRHLFPAEAD
jgi:SAM-dependent methyltransferase